MATEKPAISDVAKPGTTVPDATSKPIIVGHSAQVSDPMVSAAEAVISKPELVIAPPKPEPVATPPAAATATAGSTRPGKIAPISSSSDIQKDTDKEADKEVEENATEPKPEEDNRQARLAELIESGEYNVDISQKTSAGAVKSFLITVFVVVLVGVVVLFVLTDLKMIDLGIKLPFHIFKQ